MVGGISHARKIAALAEAFHVQVVPHNPLSPVSTAVCVQLAASIPNFAIQELPTSEEESPKRDIVTQPLTVRDGYLLVPEGPGIGIELAPGAERIPPRPRPFVTRLHEDGSVVDD
jgi:galactonate dehydratase